MRSLGKLFVGGHGIFLFNFFICFPPAM